MSAPISKYYAQKDSNGWPIPGTMMGINFSNTIPPNTIEIPTTTGNTNNRNGFRYFVRLNHQNKIIPNSLMITLHRPPDGRVLEFKLP
jgi:hypothetical protein